MNEDHNDPRHSMGLDGCCIPFLILGLLGLMFLVCFAMAALAHEIPGMHDHTTYPASCCQSAADSPTGDCAPIDDQYVTEEADGYHVNLPVGAHPKLINKGYVGVVPYKDAKKQPLDNRYHICLSTDGGHRFCFFPKPGAV